MFEFEEVEEVHVGLDLDMAEYLEADSERGQRMEQLMLDNPEELDL